jgi:hypothetical protein
MGWLSIARLREQRQRGDFGGSRRKNALNSFGEKDSNAS